VKIRKLTAIAFSVLAFASSTSSAAELNKSQVSKQFQALAPVKVLDVEEAPLPGFFQVVTERGVFYASKDGKHIMSGSLHEFKNGLKNLTAERMQLVHKAEFARLKDSYITYKAPNQKHEVVVFFDTSCGYCQKLHSEIASYNAAGITVHYAAWPRQGVTIPNSTDATPGFLELQSIWCAENPQLMLNMVARGGQPEAKTCSKARIADQFNLGVMMGIKGTPAIYSMNGLSLTDGYAPAQGILQILEKQGS
jgi:thiol:disulfide interchange protein DsbC